MCNPANISFDFVRIGALRGFLLSRTAVSTGFCKDSAEWQHCSLWDYGYEYSWLLGREIADPFFAKNPSKFAPWDYAKRVCLYPSVFETVLTAPLNTSNGTSTLIMMHFVAYVLGAAGIEQLPPPTLKTTDEASASVAAAIS